ncbi:hypothetical protein ACFVWG_13975 [Kribbella sp. NPDC058245]|uniref:hypothetical protein n=1 Tax=Kribbella sp. NPDC058245 TaxID=3346399 RepID=UPI0036E91083
MLIAAVGIAALAVAIPALIPASTPQAKAATPPTLTFTTDARSSGEVLRSMAAELRKQPATPQATRRHGGIFTTEGYSLSTSETAKDAAISAWFSKKITTDIEIGSDGTGTTRTTTVGQSPHFANEADRKTWTDSAAGDDPGSQTTTSPTPAETAAWYTRPALGTDAFLNKLFTRQPDRSTDMLLNGIAENLGSAVLEPAQRAALMDELASRNDVRFMGATIDRAGRKAYGFAHDSDRAGLPTQHLLLISPEGDLLSYEQVLTRDAGKLNVAIPATISYTLYLSATYR